MVVNSNGEIERHQKQTVVVSHDGQQHQTNFEQHSRPKENSSHTVITKKTIDPETNTYNFIDFQPIGWILQDHYKCLHDSHLFVAFDRMSNAIGPIEKYCDYVSNQLKDRMIAVGLY